MFPIDERFFRLCLIVLAAWAVPALVSQAAQPNVVLILIDDLSHYGVTAYGADRISEWSGLFENQKFGTPNIDGLAAEGLRCDHAYAYPLCEPTRIALMSGQYNSRNFLRCKSQHASEITIYSWDDAHPSAAREPETFSRAGIQDSILVKVDR